MLPVNSESFSCPFIRASLTALSMNIDDFVNSSEGAELVFEQVPFNQPVLVMSESSHKP